MDQEKPDDLVKQAINGNKAALERLILDVQGYVYNLAIRFFWNPSDAQDACQEILIKIITNLSGFEGKSTFKTWSYRIATNYLLNARRSEVEHLTFEEGAKHLAKGLEYPAYNGADKDLLEEEVKISCTTSMLVCLPRPMRLAYLIGEILEYNSKEGGVILDIDPATFRKRLSLARKRIRSFMVGNCGIYNPKNACRCHKQINYSIEVSWFNPKSLNFADKGIDIVKAKKEVDAFIDEVTIFHTHPEYQVPDVIYKQIKSLIASNKHRFLE